MTRPYYVKEPVEVFPYFKESHQAIIKYGKAIKGDLFNPAYYSGAWRGDDIPWCSAFANWCVQAAGIKGTGKSRCAWEAVRGPPRAREPPSAG